MSNQPKYLINPDDLIETRVALQNAKLAIAELIAVYKLTTPNANVNSLIRQSDELDALLKTKLNYRFLELQIKRI
jgi:hypothetical protein